MACTLLARVSLGKRVGETQLIPSEFVSVTLFFTLSFCGLDTNFFVVFLQRSQVFTRFGKLSLLHSFPNAPMHKGAFGVHQVEFMINPGEHFGDRRGVAYHTTCTHHFCQIAAWDYG